MFFFIVQCSYYKIQYNCNCKKENSREKKIKINKMKKKE